MAFSPFSSSNFLANAGILRSDEPGTGSFGLPTIFLIMSADHRLPGGLRITVLTRNTPLPVATKCSPLRMMKPTHTPASQRSSKSPTLCCVFGILNKMHSPKGTSFAVLRRPFIIWNAVLPFSRIRHRVMMWPACRTIHGTMESLRLIFSPMFSSSAALYVLTKPFTSCTARSTLPLELLSPTRDCSMAVPWPALDFTSILWTSVMAGSWSALMINRSLVRPIVSKSSRICSPSQFSEAPLDSTAYVHTLLHIDSTSTSIVMLTFAFTSSVNSSSLAFTFSVRNA